MCIQSGLYADYDDICEFFNILLEFIIINKLILIADIKERLVRFKFLEDFFLASVFL